MYINRKFIDFIVYKKVLRKINRSGATYNMFHDIDYCGSGNIAISPFPERTQIFKGKIDIKIIEKYCNKNMDLLYKGFMLGGWFDRESKQTYLDITAVIPYEKGQEAYDLGKKANQIAGFDLLCRKEFKIGGTGIFNQNVSPFKDRLIEALTLI